MSHRNNTTRFLGTLAKFVITGLVIAWVIRKLGWGTIVTTCQTVNPVYALWGLVACVVSIVLGAVQWYLLLHRKELKIRFREAFELYYVGMFFSNIGMVAGDTLRVAYIKRRHDMGKLGFAATFLDRFAGLLALSGCAGAGCAYLLWSGEFHSPSVKTIVLFTAGLVALFGVMLAFLMVRRLRRVMIAAVNVLPLPKKEFITNLISVTGLDYSHLLFVAGIGLLSLVIQVLRISTHIAVAASLGILTQGNLPFFFILIPLMSLVMIVPLPFGVRETIGGSLFALSGIPAGAAYIMQFMATIIGFAGSLWGGIEFLITGTRRSRAS
ncbi:MAG: flippase-like domain-containing protein [Chitinispirillaceae bacterium]|jgi:hypothetical protein|nr:flippase-like domain-containing protein [Chitinispirillaceae bacterium]